MTQIRLHNLSDTLKVKVMITIFDGKVIYEMKK